MYQKEGSYVRASDGASQRSTIREGWSFGGKLILMGGPGTTLARVKGARSVPSARRVAVTQYRINKNEPTSYLVGSFFIFRSP